MSDERIYITCEKCGKSHKLVSIYHQDDADKPTDSASLLAFMREHVSECWAFQWESTTSPGFKLESEYMMAAARNRP